jgi:hypothetical protein
VLLVVMLGCGGRGGGCTDLALEALELVRFLVASPGATPSMDVRVESIVPLSEFDTMLGRLTRAGRFPKSAASMTPGPIDFLGGLVMLLFDTGG